MQKNKISKVKTKVDKIKEFFLSRNGKIVAGAGIIIVFAIGGLSIWNRGSVVREGYALCQKGEFAQAQSYFKKAITKDNMNPEYYNALGAAYLGAGSYDDSIKQYSLALNLDKENQTSYRGTGIAYLKKGEYETAVEYLNKALAHSGLWVDEIEYDILWYRAEAENAMKDYEALAETYDVIVQVEGNTALNLYYRGHAYCLCGEKELAMKDFDEAVAQKGNSYELFWNVYDSMAAAGWKEEGLEYLKLTETPGYVDESQVSSEAELRKYKGMVQYICQNYEDAIELLSHVTLEDDAQAQSYLALAYEMQGEASSALNIFLQEVTRTDADADADAYNQIAKYLIRKQEGSQALLYLNQAVELFAEKDLKDIYYNRVTAYEIDGEYELALDALKEYVAIYGETEATEHERAFLKERVRD